MVSKTAKSERRTAPLSKDAIIAAAIEILDDKGEGALTFRALATRLQTGSGAIYWHVADKQALLAAATDHVVAAIIVNGVKDAEPREAIRTFALGVFDAIDTHPWIGGQLSRDPWQHAVLRILEGVGGRIQALGVPADAQFNVATAIMSFILGLAGQYALGAGMSKGGVDRATALGEIATRWAQLDQDTHPFVRQIATQLAEHDDREQFLAGIDLILSGIEPLREHALL
ncbi:TetR/AcrR family transcriptional regulator [Sphingomonas sp. TX0543]|uniref:TetR/AcrR family transcriptional regulator n=1 Tax=Sphingomonas sp. TX0543 TaxID=3399682 RepID=UPI003AFB7A1E